VFSKKHPVTKQTVLSSVTFLSLKMKRRGMTVDAVVALAQPSLAYLSWITFYSVPFFSMPVLRTFELAGEIMEIDGIDVKVLFHDFFL